VIDVVAYKQWPVFLGAYDLLWSAHHLIDEGQLTARLDQGQIEGYLNCLKERSRGEGMNPFTGKRVCRERTPGNFSSRIIEGKTYFCVYDVDGCESRVELPDDKPGPASQP